MTVKERLATAGVMIFVAGTVGFIMQNGELISSKYQQVTSWQPEVTTEISPAQLVSFSQADDDLDVVAAAEIDLIRPDEMMQIEARAVPTLAMVPLSSDSIN